MLCKMVEDVSNIGFGCCMLLFTLSFDAHDGNKMAEDMGNNGFVCCMMAWMMALDAL